jgi:hypothetical protein
LTINVQNVNGSNANAVLAGVVMGSIRFKWIIPFENDISENKLHNLKYGKVQIILEILIKK